jgi:hypothetical protein
MKILANIDHWIFKNIGPSQFIFMAIFLSILGDGTYLIFIKFVLGTEENLTKWMNEYHWIPNMKLILQNPELRSQMQHNFHSLLNILIGAVIFINMIGYFYFIKKKKFAVKYVRNLAITGSMLGIFAVWEARQHGTTWVVLMSLLIPLYLIIYRGFKFHNIK